MDFTPLLETELINNLDFNNFVSNYFVVDSFLRKPSDEPYRLLCYLSTLFNNKHIIDIGTGTGNSALALSYNDNNKVYTFDIVDRIHFSINNKSNIEFVLADIVTNKETRENYKNLILSSAFIFLDLDSHNGAHEYEFYTFLKENNYNGFVICDNIWYYKEMRDNFWYKIPSEFKYDISTFGHWTGTGVFTFNENIKFHKYDNSDWTLVTGYFNLTKCPDASEEICKRDKSYYFSHSLSTLHLPYNLVIYCDKESYDELVKIRPVFLQNKTKYVIMEFDEIAVENGGLFSDNRFGHYRDVINNNRKQKPYYFDNRNTASYYLFCMSRYAMLRETIEQNPFNSSYFCWINFCIERMGYSNLKYLDEALAVKRDKFSTCYIDYIPHSLIKDTHEYFRWGRCSMCSGFFTGNKEYMHRVCSLILQKFIQYMSQGYGHADEQLYSPVYFENKDLFEHYYGDYLQMITNYKYVYEAPENPIRNFISNSFKHEDFEKCIEGCEFLLRSFVLDKCNLNNDQLNFILDKYVCSKLSTKFYIMYELKLNDAEISLACGIIRNLLNSGSNAKCMQFCENFIRFINDTSYDVGDETYFSIYFTYYVSSFYIDRNKAKLIVNEIINKCKEDKKLRCVYLKNRKFYDDQFSFSCDHKLSTTFKSSKLAYYTCFFGDINNMSFLIPKLPSTEHDCYYFTNNHTMYGLLMNTDFIPVLVDYAINCDSNELDIMKSKHVKCNLFDLNLLNSYEYICWFDNKLEVFHENIEATVNELQNSEQSIVLVKHPFCEKYNNIWDEYNLSISSEKYKREAEKYVNYINAMINNGYKQENKGYYPYSGLFIRKNNQISKSFSLDWFNNIGQCGIQCEISLFFVLQDYNDKIKMIDYNSACKHFSD